MKRTGLTAALCGALTLVSCSAALAENGFDWSGHLRAQGVASIYDDRHFLAVEHGDNLFLDGGFDARLNGSLYAGERFAFHIAYEAVLKGGQTRETVSDLADSYPGVNLLFEYQNEVISDESQLFSLTRIISESDSYLLYHRLDRLYLAYDTGRGHLSFGRQAVTWGNGMLFNPADLINPFPPSDIVRDYKVGSDMVIYQHGFGWVRDFQAIVVPRTNRQDDLSSDDSTLGMKCGVSVGETDLDLYVLKNYQDPVIGGGLVTFAGDGIVRSDLVWTYLEDDPDRDSFFSGVVNYDYSWSWADRNWYGFVEFYYNGLGSSDASAVRDNIALLERLKRGEIFVTGRYYVDAMLQYEAHPLVNIFSTIIYNLGDNSFLFQPRLSWDFTSSAQLLIGANIASGSTGTEFGERVDPQTSLVIGNPMQLYLLVTWYF